MAAPHANPGPRVVLIAPDLRMAAELKAALGNELPRAAVVTLESYPVAGLRDALADLCFLDFSSDHAAALRTLSALAARHPAPPVVVLLNRDDPDLILRCLRQGAAEFLVQPFTNEQLRSALAKLSRFHPPSNGGGGDPGKTGRVFCVVPAKGACGGTSVACNLAFALKRLHPGRVLLADLDGLTGTVPFLLKLKSNYSFVDALSHAEHLDAELWRALVTPCQGVDVLLSPENPVESIGQCWDPGSLLDSSRQLYDVVLLDLSSAYGDWNLTLAAHCDQVLLVATNELPALHAAQRATAYLLGNGIDPDKIRTIINRYRRGVGLSRESIETALDTELLHMLPSDYEAMQKALLEGKPVPSASDFGKSVAALAARLCGKPTEPKRRGGPLWSLFRRVN